MSTYYNIEIGVNGHGYWQFDITDEHISEIVGALRSGNRVLFGHRFVESKNIDSIHIIETSYSLEGAHGTDDPDDEATNFEVLKNSGMNVTYDFLQQSVGTRSPADISASFCVEN